MNRMHPVQPSRRQWLAGTLAAGLAAPAVAAPAADTAEPFGYCLNTATIRGQKLSLVDQIETAARAGFTGLEPWVRDLEEHAKGGGDLRDVAKRLRDRGLTVESAIAFNEWAV